MDVELLINSTKRFLSKPEYRIQLNELLAAETDRLIVQLNSADFTASGQWNQMAACSNMRRFTEEFAGVHGWKCTEDGVS